MSVDKNKISAEATRLLQKGQLDKAIRAYERILAADPADTRALLKIAEIQQKKGEIPAAAETFSRVAEAYATQGFFLKSVAVYKQVLKLSPDDVRVSERLGQLYQQLGLVSEAMAQLHAIVRWAERAGDDDKLLEALRRVVEIDPENVPSSVKLGELYARLSQPKLAVEHFRRAADQLKRNNRLDEYGKVAERIAALVPDDHVLAREVAAIFLARGDAKRALHNLQQCYRADPRQLETLTLLAKVFEELGQETKTAAVQREIARLHDEAGRRDEANAAWKRVAELEPDDAEAADALAAHSPATAPPASGAPPRPPPVPATRPDVSEAGPAGAPATAQRTGPAVAAETDPAIAKILGESDVYVKYGLHEKALEHLQKILATQPDHVEAREKASRIREQRKDIAGAADDAQRAIRAAHAQGLVDRARAGLERLRGLSPTHPEIAQLEALLAGGAPAKVEHEHEGVVLELDDLATEPLDQDAVASGEPPAEVGPDDLALSAIVPPADDQVLEGPPSADAEAILAARPDGLDDEVETVEEEEGELPAEIAAPVAEAAAPAPDRAPPPAAAPAQREPAPEPVVDEALQQDLAEADFFVSQGLLDEARAFLSELAERYPGHPAVAAKLQ